MGVKKSLLGSLSGHFGGNPESHFLSHFYSFGVRGVLEGFQDHKTKCFLFFRGRNANRFIIFTLFRTFSHFFRIFPPGLSPSKQRVLAQ